MIGDGGDDMWRDAVVVVAAGNHNELVAEVVNLSL